jgi:hypothetical protein
MFADTAVIDARTLARLAHFCTRHGAKAFADANDKYAILTTWIDEPYHSTTRVKVVADAGAPVLDVERQVVEFTHHKELVHTYTPGLWIGALVTLACNVQAASGRPWEGEVRDEF